MNYVDVMSVCWEPA